MYDRVVIQGFKIRDLKFWQHLLGGSNMDRVTRGHIFEGRWEMIKLSDKYIQKTSRVHERTYMHTSTEAIDSPHSSKGKLTTEMPVYHVFLNIVGCHL